MLVVARDPTCQLPARIAGAGSFHVKHTGTGRWHGGAFGCSDVLSWGTQRASDSRWWPARGGGGESSKHTRRSRHRGEVPVSAGRARPELLECPGASTAMRSAKGSLRVAHPEHDLSRAGSFTARVAVLPEDHHRTVTMRQLKNLIGPPPAAEASTPGQQPGFAVSRGTMTGTSSNRGSTAHAPPCRLSKV